MGRTVYRPLRQRAFPPTIQPVGTRGHFCPGLGLGQFRAVENGLASEFPETVKTYRDGARCANGFHDAGVRGTRFVRLLAYCRL